MPQVFIPSMEHNLARLERILDRPGRSRMAGRELREYLKYLHDLLIRQKGRAQVDDGTHQALHQLLRRTETVRNPEEARNLIRDIRQFQLTISSMNKAWDVENRLHDLEQQVKTVAEASTETVIPDADVITLESLKNKRLLFAIMPFSAELQDVWTGGIKRAANGTGLTPVRIDMITQSSEITDDIVKTIQGAEVVVIDVTGANPNVMFEFGFALAIRKRLVVISQSTEYLTFDIKNLRTLIYRNTWQGVENLHKDLQPFIKGAIGKRPKKKLKSASTPT